MKKFFAIFLLLCGTAQADPLPMVTLKLVKKHSTNINVTVAMTA